MDYVDAIRRQAEDAPRAALPAVSAALWRAFGEGHVTETEAEALASLIEARQVPSGSRRILSDPALSTGTDVGELGSRGDCQSRPRTSVGSRPRSDASLERRRRWAASGRLPPAIAARFTLAEQAALALVAAEAARKGDCRLSVPNLAAVAGVAETTVRNAIREARKLALLTVEERPITHYRNDTNVVRIVSSEWTAWLRLARKGGPAQHSRHRQRVESRDPRQGSGCKSPNRTPTRSSKQGKTRTVDRSQGRSASLEAMPPGSSRIADA